MTKTTQPKEKLNLNLSREAKTKAKTIAAQMNVSVSHLMEGLIMGAGFMYPKLEEGEHDN